MSGPYDYLDSRTTEELEPIWNLFIPNEKIEIVVQISDGFLVFTNRRLVLLDSKWGVSKSTIKKVFPLDVLHGLYEKKQGKWCLEIIKAGKFGNLEGKMKDGEMKYKTRDFNFSPHKSKKDKESVLQRFTEGMETLQKSIVEKSRIISDPEYVHIPDCSYLADETPVVIPIKGGTLRIDHEKTKYNYKYVSHKGASFIYNGHFSHALLVCLENDLEKKRTGPGPGFIIHYLKYNAERQMVETNYDGSPKFAFNTVTLESGQSDYAIWKWPMENLPWITADAYFCKMNKLIPANIPKTESEKPRLWH